MLYNSSSQVIQTHYLRVVETNVLNQRNLQKKIVIY